MKRRQRQESASTKTNRILNGILITFILIMIRVWHVAIVEHEKKEEASKKPQMREVVLKANRAFIFDRFGIPLATNQVRYNVSVSYGGIREVPRAGFRIDEAGKRIKYPRRTEYIERLSRLLGSELQMDSARIEDIIHSKASLFGRVPFLIKEGISEEIYFRLKMKEKDWPGLHAESVAIRHYPQTRMGADVMGYLGAMSRAEYEGIMNEMQLLRTYLSRNEEGSECELPKGCYSLESVRKRLEELEARAYTLTDLVGKAGVEKSFDEKLRGSPGAKMYLADIQGNFLQELEGSYEPESGERLYLSISSEMQEYAESLLADYEKVALPDQAGTPKQLGLFPEKAPWIKGGAIVVMDPNNGEVLALASYPRFNPNDFIQKKERLHQWLESEAYIGALWDERATLTRERFDGEKFYEESRQLSWDTFLAMILPQTSPVLRALDKVKTIERAIFVQKKVEDLLALFKSEKCRLPATKIFEFLYPSEGLSSLELPEKEFLTQRLHSVSDAAYKLKEQLEPFFHALSSYDMLLLTDLCRVALDADRFSPKLLEYVGEESLADYRNMESALVSMDHALQKVTKELYHEIDFKVWKEREFKSYLALKREEEQRAKKRYGRPYIEYLDEIEAKMFKEFWTAHKWEFFTFFLADKQSNSPYFSKIASLRGHLEEDQRLRLKQKAEEFDPVVFCAYLRTTRSFEELGRPLLGRYPSLRHLNGTQLERHLAASFYPKDGFGYGRSHAFRQSTAIGSIFKLVPAYEALRQKYLTIEREGKKQGNLNPLTIVDDKRKSGKDWSVGFTTDGHLIPRFYHGGRLPRSDHSGIGEVDLVHALAASSNPYFAILAGDVLSDPEDLCKAAALFSYGEKTGIDLPHEIKGNIPQDVTYNRTGLYSFAIGQHSLVGTPLQSAVMLAAIANGGDVLKPQIVKGRNREVKREILLPDCMRDLLIKGMRQVILGEKGTARALQHQFPKELLDQIVGKTSTAEAIERVSLDGQKGSVKVKHVAFGAVSFHEDKTPELVVVTYLRFGDYGRDAAPICVKMIQKWREIQK